MTSLCDDILFAVFGALKLCVNSMFVRKSLVEVAEFTGIACLDAVVRQDTRDEYACVKDNASNFDMEYRIVAGHSVVRYGGDDSSFTHVSYSCMKPKHPRVSNSGVDQTFFYEN